MSKKENNAIEQDGTLYDGCGDGWFLGLDELNCTLLRSRKTCYLFKCVCGERLVVRLNFDHIFLDLLYLYSLWSVLKPMWQGRTLRIRNTSAFTFGENFASSIELRRSTISFGLRFRCSKWTHLCYDTYTFTHQGYWGSFGYVNEHHISMVMYDF